MNEISAGGVVMYGNSVLCLRKYNGDWVLPKGRVESGETLEQTALREVHEETGLICNITEYLGKINFNYKNLKTRREINKTVHWYLMNTNNTNTIPQKSEGFIKASFIHIFKASKTLRYEDERSIIRRALEVYLNEG